MHRVPPFDAGYAWFLDIDGTLLDIAAVPSAVRARPSDTQLLTSLYALSRGALALISGRSIAGIDAIFAPLRLPAAGQHGTERRDARGRERRHPVPEAELRQAAAQLEAFAARHEGLLFEDKGASLAVHYRLAPALGGVVHATMRRLAVRLGPSVEVQSGKLLAELKPAGRNKGHAIEAFLTEPPFRGRVPIFLGDDVTDEHVFEVVNRRGGLSVKIGAGPSLARWRLRDAAAVRAWLAHGIAAAQKKGEPQKMGQEPISG